jgi:hypothetical protein
MTTQLIQDSRQRRDSCCLLHFLQRRRPDRTFSKRNTQPSVLPFTLAVTSRYTTQNSGPSGRYSFLVRLFILYFMTFILAHRNLLRYGCRFTRRAVQRRVVPALRSGYTAQQLGSSPSARGLKVRGRKTRNDKGCGGVSAEARSLRGLPRHLSTRSSVVRCLRSIREARSAYRRNFLLDVTPFPSSTITV